MSTIEDRLTELGITLPTPAAPVANYVPFVLHGSMLVISGQLALSADGKLAPEHKGKIGGGVDEAAATAAARLCVINILAQAKAALGDLETIGRLLKLTVFVASDPSFTDQHKVANGASDFLVEMLGERGRHARSAVGVPALPMNAAVEIEATFEVA